MKCHAYIPGVWARVSEIAKWEESPFPDYPCVYRWSFLSSDEIKSILPADMSKQVLEKNVPEIESFGKFDGVCIEEIPVIVKAESDDVKYFVVYHYVFECADNFIEVTVREECFNSKNVVKSIPVYTEYLDTAWNVLAAGYAEIAELANCYDSLTYIVYDGHTFAI